MIVSQNTQDKLGCDCHNKIFIWWELEADCMVANKCFPLEVMLGHFRWWNAVVNGCRASTMPKIFHQVDFLCAVKFHHIQIFYEQYLRKYVFI